MARSAAAAVIVFVVVSIFVPTGSASACSCEERLPTVADSVGEVDIAFVGRLESTEEIDPETITESSEYYDVRYELIVEHAVKGVQAGDRIVMFGDLSGGSSCGTSELTRGLDRHPILSTERGGRFVADSTPPCTGLPTVDELLDVDLTLPATSAGPVSLVVTGRVGEAELISYDADGRPVAYGDAPWRAGAPAVCPESDRIVQIERDQTADSVTMTVRDLATLEGVARVDLTDAAVTNDTVSGLDDFIVDGAVLDCRSAEGTEVVALLGWENTGGGQTTLIEIGSDGALDISALGQVSRARFDDVTGDVVGERNGQLVSITSSGEPKERIVAQLSSGPDEARFVATFVVPGGDGGWWVGLGPAGSYDIASALDVLVRVDGSGGVERWPVDGPVDFFDGAVLDGDRLVGGGRSIPLPPPGSSTDGKVVGSEIVDEFPYEIELDDGRDLRWVAGDGRTQFVVIGANGETTVLEHLLELRGAVSVIEGPIVDPADSRRDLEPGLVTSTWITAEGAAALDRQPVVTGAPTSEPVTSAASAASSTDASTEQSAPPAVVRSDDGDGRLVVVAVLAVISGAAALAVWFARRRRRHS